MSRTIRGWWKGRDKSLKNNKERKQFMWRGEGWSCKARGGIGNKRAWAGSGGIRVMPRWLYKKYKEKPLNDE